MLGMFHLLPLLDGWDYKTHVVEQIVDRGLEPMSIVRVDKILAKERGWLMEIHVLTDDAYAELILEFRGAGGEVQRYSFSAENFRMYGAFQQDPAGWVQRYDRPNPNSSQGIYLVVPFSAGVQGTTWPYVPPVHLKLFLPNESTQETAYIHGEAFVIAITEEEAFRESLKPFMGTDLLSEIAGLLRKTPPLMSSSKPLPTRRRMY